MLFSECGEGFEDFFGSGFIVAPRATLRVEEQRVEGGGPAVAQDPRFRPPENGKTHHRPVGKQQEDHTLVLSCAGPTKLTRENEHSVTYLRPSTAIKGSYLLPMPPVRSLYSAQSSTRTSTCCRALRARVSSAAPGGAPAAGPATMLSWKTDNRLMAV